MATQIITANVTTTTAGDHAVDIAALGDALIVNPSIVISATGAGANGINAPNHVAYLEILGNVTSGQGAGISLQHGNFVVIGRDSSVFAASFGLSAGGYNAGSIASLSGDAVKLTGLSFNELVNTGLIVSQFGIGVTGESGDDTVINSGRISGGVNLGSGNDVYDARGGGWTEIVFLGVDDDIALGSDAGERLVGSGGNDVLEGNGGNDVFESSIPFPSANDGDDTIDGGAGRDTYRLAGTALATKVDLEAGFATGLDIGTDELVDIENVFGVSGLDSIAGDALSNVLRGGNAVDTLSGRGGIDYLFGDAGADTLAGGTERDVLTGGSEADRFDFNALADSGITAATRDRIKDFQHLMDDIDLSTLDAKAQTPGNQAFAFIGLQSLTAAGGQVRVETVNGGKLVLINNDADVAAEMAIFLQGNVTLSAADFIL